MTGELSETKVSFISHGSIARTRKDMNKPPTFLFLDDSLVKEQRAAPRGQALHRRRADSPVARPTQPTLSDEVRGRIEVRRQRSAASRAGEPSCQPPRYSASAPETTDTSRQEGQRSPDPVTRISSAPPTIPKTARTPPHPPVDRGAPSVKVGIGSPTRPVNQKIAESAKDAATAFPSAAQRPSDGAPFCLEP